jgi:hypothetical protein
LSWSIVRLQAKRLKSKKRQQLKSLVLDNKKPAQAGFLFVHYLCIICALFLQLSRVGVRNTIRLMQVDFLSAKRLPNANAILGTSWRPKCCTVIQSALVSNATDSSMRATVGTR